MATKEIFKCCNCGKHFEDVGDDYWIECPYCQKQNGHSLASQALHQEPCKELPEACKAHHVNYNEMPCKECPIPIKPQEPERGGEGG